MSSKLKFTMLMFLTAAVAIPTVLTLIKSKQAGNKIPYGSTIPAHVSVVREDEELSEEIRKSEEDPELAEAIRISKEDDQARQAKERVEREKLRKEQDEAYEKSLAADQEKERIRAEEEKAVAQGKEDSKKEEEPPAQTLTPEQIREKRIAYFQSH